MEFDEGRGGPCEDAPCCGCCGPQGDSGWYDEPIDLYGGDADVMEYGDGW